MQAGKGRSGRAGRESVQARQATKQGKQGKQARQARQAGPGTTGKQGNRTGKTRRPIGQQERFMTNKTVELLCICFFLDSCAIHINTPWPVCQTNVCSCATHLKRLHAALLAKLICCVSGKAL